MTSSALKKKQIRDEIVVHLVNSDLLDENALDTVEIGKEERSGSVNSELTLQLQIKQMEIDAKKEIEKHRLAFEREQLASKEKLNRSEYRRRLNQKKNLKEKG